MHRGRAAGEQTVTVHGGRRGANNYGTVHGWAAFVLLIVGFLYIPDASLYRAVGVESLLSSALFFFSFFLFGRHGFSVFYLSLLFYMVVSEGTLHLLKEAVTRGWSTIAMALGLSSWVVIFTIGSRIYYSCLLCYSTGVGAYAVYGFDSEV